MLYEINCYMKVTGGQIGHNLPKNLQDFKGSMSKSGLNRKEGVIGRLFQLCVKCCNQDIKKMRQPWFFTGSLHYLATPFLNKNVLAISHSLNFQQKKCGSAELLIQRSCVLDSFSTT